MLCIWSEIRIRSWHKYCSHMPINTTNTVMVIEVIEVEYAYHSAPSHMGSLLLYGIVHTTLFTLSEESCYLNRHAYVILKVMAHHGLVWIWSSFKHSVGPFKISYKKQLQLHWAIYLCMLFILLNFVKLTFLKYTFVPFRDPALHTSPVWGNSFFQAQVKVHFWSKEIHFSLFESLELDS